MKCCRCKSMTLMGMKCRQVFIKISNATRTARNTRRVFQKRPIIADWWTGVFSCYAEVFPPLSMHKQRSWQRAWDKKLPQCGSQTKVGMSWTEQAAMIGFFWYTPRICRFAFRRLHDPQLSASIYATYYSTCKFSLQGNCENSSNCQFTKIYQT